MTSIIRLLLVLSVALLLVFAAMAGTGIDSTLVISPRTIAGDGQEGGASGFPRPTFHEPERPRFLLCSLNVFPV